MRKPWYEKTVEKYGKKALWSAVVSIAVTALFSFWYFASGRSFAWHSISPIPQPGFLDSELYGAIAFLTIGAFLYYVVKLWLILKIICKDILGSWDLYNGVKAIVWFILLLVTQFYIVPTIIDWANAIVSFFYNMWFLLLYVFPPLGILLIGFLIAILLWRRKARNS
jgi:hypothetical protein